MKYQKKAFWIIAALISTSFISGCSSEDIQPATNKTKTIAKAYRWEQASAGPQTAKMPTLSKDNKFMYFATAQGNALHVVDISSDIPNAMKDPAHWQKPLFKTQGTGLNESAGLAKLAGADTVYGISAADKGAFVAVGTQTGHSNDANGLIYIEGTQATFAWSHTAALRGLGWGIHLDSATYTARDFLRSGYPVYGFSALTAAGKEFIYIMTRAGGTTTIGTGPLAAQKISNYITYDNIVGPHLFTDPYMAQAAKGREVFIVDQNGVSFIASSQIGEAGNLVPSVNTSTPGRGSNAWKFAGGGNNYYVQALTLVDDNLFIALGSLPGKALEPDQGGVAVYHVALKNTAPMDAAWKGIAVLGFAVENNRVWAVTQKGIFSVESNGVKGAALNNSQDGNNAAGVTMPQENITGAQFVKDTLVITTSDKGIFYRLFE